MNALDHALQILMDVDVFAIRAAKSIEHHTSYVVIPWQMGWVARVMRLLPNWLYDRLAVNAPRKPRQAVTSSSDS